MKVSNIVSLIKERDALVEEQLNTKELDAYTAITDRLEAVENEIERLQGDLTASGKKKNRRFNINE